MSADIPGGRDEAQVDLAARDRSFGTVAVAASAIAAGLSAIYWLSRIGFTNPVLPVAKALVLSLFLISAPYAARMITRRLTRSYSWETSYSFYWLIALVVAAFAGRASAATGINAFPVIGALGVISFVVLLADWIRGAALWRSLVIVLGSIAFSTFAGGVVWGRIYKSPVFNEMLQATGIVHHDPIGLAAIANMLRTYGVPSVGLDGLVAMNYHWGSMWTFGQLSELLGAHTMDFYNLGYVVTMLPLFFGGILAFAVEIHNARPVLSGDARTALDFRNRLRVLALFLVATIGVFPITGMDAMGVWTSNLMISESYAIGLGVTLLLAATAVVFIRSLSGTKLSRLGDWLFVVVILPLGLVGVGYLKISMMILGFAAVMYAALRLGFFRRLVFIALGVALTAVVLIALQQTSLPQHREGVMPFDFLKGFVPPSWWPFFLVVQLFWSWLFIALRFRSAGIRTFADLRAALANRSILDAELVALVALAGVAPGFLTHIDGGSAFYFADIQRWLSVGLLMAMAASLVPSITRPPSASPLRSLRSLRSLCLVFLSAPLLYSMGANSVHWTKRMLAANAGLRRDLYPDSVAARIPPGGRSIAHLADGELLQRGLEASPGYLPVIELQSLALMPRDERSRTALFIPQSERRYWELLKRPGACSFSAHVAPAFASMTMIDGMPPYGCELSRYYGLAFYQQRSRDQMAQDTLPAALCSRAAPSGITRVMTLHFDETGRAQRRVDECRSTQ